MSAKNLKKVHLMENPHARAEKTSHFTARILFSLLLLQRSSRAREQGCSF